METQSSARSDLEAALWTEVLELTLDIVHTVLRYRPQSDTPSALDKCLLASATDSSDVLQALSGDQDRSGDNAILNIANLAQHKGSPLIPSLATKVRAKGRNIKAEPAAPRPGPHPLYLRYHVDPDANVSDISAPEAAERIGGAGVSDGLPLQHVLVPAGECTCRRRSFGRLARDGNPHCLAVRSFLCGVFFSVPFSSQPAPGGCGCS